MGLAAEESNWLLSVSAPLDRVMSGECLGTEFWPEEKILPLGLLPERGWAGVEGRAVRRAEPGPLRSASRLRNPPHSFSSQRGRKKNHLK